MPRLLARGPSQEERRVRLRPDRVVRLGRAPTVDAAEGERFEVAWEPSLSREHAELVWSHGRLKVTRLELAKNPIFFKGKASSSFDMELGEHFVVGDTTFTLAEDRASVAHEDPTPLEIVGYTLAEIRETRYRDPDERIEVLASLPGVLRRAASDEELFSSLALLLMQAIAAAEVVAVVRSRSEGAGVEVLYWDSRRATTTELRPSKRLIVEAVEHRRQSVKSVWGGAGSNTAEFTVAEAYDWAYCTPVPGASCAGWGLYVAGKSEDSRFDLRPDVKFTELVADLLGAMRDFQTLQQRQTALGRFFSPVTLPMLSSAEGEKALAPRQTEVTVLFCDLRGFSREAERSKDDLMGLLERVSRALDVMTQCIHTQHGVIGDFQGDAALAFWGWPIEEDDSALRACRAAVEIRQRFARVAERSGDPLSGFRCGVGVATGEAVAGRLGTSGQFKIDVFGPVVNLASRLEGITKQLRVPILVDDRTVERVRRAAVGEVRFRRLARLRPFGMDQPVTVSELLPEGGGVDVLDEDDVARYEKALDAFTNGSWDDAFTLLHEVPPWDHGKDFLTSYILRHQRQPPPGWDGVIPMESK